MAIEAVGKNTNITPKCEISLVIYLDGRKPVLHITDKDNKKKKIVLH